MDRRVGESIDANDGLSDDECKLIHVLVNPNERLSVERRRLIENGTVQFE